MFIIKFLFLIFLYIIQNVISTDTTILLNNKFIIQKSKFGIENRYLTYSRNWFNSIRSLQINRQINFWEIEKVENVEGIFYMKILDSNNGLYYYICQSKNELEIWNVELACKHYQQFYLEINKSNNVLYIIFKNGMFKNKYLSSTSNRVTASTVRRDSFIFKIEKDTLPKNSKDYLITKIIGINRNVWDVIIEETGQHYAMKYLSIQTKNDKIAAENEVEILKSLDHEHTIKFHMRLVEKSKNNNEIDPNKKNEIESMDYYLIFDLLKGGTLRDVLDNYEDLTKLKKYIKGKFNYFPIDKVRYHAAWLFSIIDNLHEKRILHKNIKPENLMFDVDNGNLILISFGLAEKVSLIGPGSVAGSFPYMPPEAIDLYYNPKHKSNGYTYPADIWSIGIVLYEMLTGTLPITKDYIEAAGKSTLTKKNLKEYLNLGQLDDKSPERDFISKLLLFDPKQRIQTLQQVIDHPWFKDFDWEQILKTKKAIEPFSLFSYLKSIINKIKQFFKNLIGMN